MIKTNHRYLAAIIFLISLLNVPVSKNLFASKDHEQYILGRVVYSDNNSPVSEGFIKVYSTSLLTGSVIESASINFNGEFELSKTSIWVTDNIRIMAYPNDQLDNMTVPFDPYVLDFEKAITNPESKYSLMLKVQRSQSTSKPNDAKKYGGIILKQNFPNPFNPSTLISFDLPNTSRVSLKVYNMRGESIVTLIDNKILSVGNNEIEFNAESLPSGIYIYSLKAGEYNLNRKMILLK